MLFMSTYILLLSFFSKRSGYDAIERLVGESLRKKMENKIFFTYPYHERSFWTALKKMNQKKDTALLLDFTDTLYSESGDSQ